MKNLDSKKINIWFRILILIDLIIVICFYIVYFNSNFRNFWITSTIKTATHQYLAHVFYSDDMIKETISNNTVSNILNNTDSSKIEFDNTDTGVYESIYEEQILKRDGNDLYKYFSIDVNNSKAHVVVIYDSSRIHYAISDKVDVGGQLLKDLASSKDAIVAINASGFKYLDKKIIPAGTIIKDGKIILQNGKFTPTMGLIGFNKDHVLVLTKDTPEKAIEDGMVDAMTFGPFLVVNGVYADISGNGGWGYAPRTVIAQRKDGIVLFIVFDGRSTNTMGASMKDLIDIAKRYKLYNMANLDGGGSSTLVINNEVINKTGGFNYTGDRYLPDAWILK